MIFFLLPIVFAFAGRILFLYAKKKRRDGRLFSTVHTKTHALVALATTGFTGIALEIVLLYAFQNIYGYIYERIGVIIALFMVGLACGGYAANKMIQKRNSDWIKVLMMLEGMIAGYAIIVPFLISAISAYSVIAETVLVFLVMVTGILTGIEFPIANKICAQCNDNIAVSAGVTDGVERSKPGIACFRVYFTNNKVYIVKEMQRIN